MGNTLLDVSLTTTLRWSLFGIPAPTAASVVALVACLTDEAR